MRLRLASRARCPSGAGKSLRHLARRVRGSVEAHRHAPRPRDRSATCVLRRTVAPGPSSAGVTSQGGTPSPEPQRRVVDTTGPGQARARSSARRPESLFCYLLAGTRTGARLVDTGAVLVPLAQTCTTDVVGGSIRFHSQLLGFRITTGSLLEPRAMADVSLARRRAQSAGKSPIVTRGTELSCPVHSCRCRAGTS
jgi:hypothetical protein